MKIAEFNGTDSARPNAVAATASGRKKH